jgi:hypothetical protein
MLTYTSFSVYHKKEKKFYGVQSIDFINNIIKVCEKEKIGIGEGKVKEVNHIKDFELEEVILFVALDIVKGSKKKQHPQMMTLQNIKIVTKQKRKKVKGVK